MTKKDFETFGDILDKKFDQKLKPLNEKLGIIDKKVGVLDKKVDVLDEKVSAHSASLITLEKEIKAYLDALDVERKRIDRQDGRFEVIEESLGLNQ